MPRYMVDVILALDIECLGPEDIELTVMGEFETLPALFIRSSEIGDYTEYET